MTYITGLGTISPQPTLDSDTFLAEIIKQEGVFLKAVEPNYREYINPRLLRRMSKIIKMGIATSKVCMHDSGVEQPDGIIVGTGLGCMQDTEKFLTSVIQNEEQMLNPTSFIQSTHNTIGGQIALLNKCNCYNTTYSQRGFSLEYSLLDAMLMLKEGTGKHVLVGGIDEVTENSFAITNRMGLWKQNLSNHLRLLESEQRGTISGEGASFFMLSDKPGKKSYARLQAVSTFFKPEDLSSLKLKINAMLEEAGINEEEVDVLLLGLSGAQSTDHHYKDLQETYFSQTPTTFFKHLRGESYTSSAFALWLAAKMIYHQHIPDSVKYNAYAPKDIKHVLLYNHYLAYHHSLMLISAC